MSIDPTFRCDGDLWLGIYDAAGSITIGRGVGASGPLTITAIRSLKIGNDVLIGPNVMLTDHYHGDVRDPKHRAMLAGLRPLISPGEVTIEDNVHLGANVVVLSPATIGAGTIVGANVVVKGTVPADVVWTGAPRDRSAIAPT